MSFNPDDHNSVKKTIGNVSFNTSVWMKNHITLAPEDEVRIMLAVQSGAAQTTLWPNSNEIKSIIEVLELTLDNIKAAELELLALQTKAAA